MGAAQLRLVIRLRPCGAGPARVCFKARIPKPEMAAKHPRITRQRWRGKLPLARIHPAGLLSNPNAPASRVSAGGASSRLPAEGSTTPKHGQGGPCPSTLRVAPQIRTPPPTRQRWRGKLPLAHRRIHDAQTRARKTLPLHPAGRLANPNATAHAPALEGQAPACPPKNPRRPNTGKEDLAPPPCGSPPESERPRITRQRWRGKLPLARQGTHSHP
jgi:hypothetical protein